MGFPWKKIGVGLKIALGIAIKLNDAHVIQVKELDKARSIKDIVEAEIKANTPQ